MDKKDKDKLFDAYIDGQLSSQESSEYEKLCENDPAFQEKVMIFQKLRNQLRKQVNPDNANVNMDYFWNALKDRMEHQKSFFSQISEIVLLPFRYKIAFGMITALFVTLIGFGIMYKANYVSPVNNECVVDYVNNRTSYVTIFQTPEENITVIWLTENPIETAKNMDKTSKVYERSKISISG